MVFVPDYNCACDPDGLPCEDHMIVLVSRDGAAARTADELLSVFAHDAIAILGESTPWARELLKQYDAALDGNRAYGVAWLPDTGDGESLRDDMHTLVSQLETDLAVCDEPMSVHWDDGFVIFQVTADSPLNLMLLEGDPYA